MIFNLRLTLVGTPTSPTLGGLHSNAPEPILRLTTSESKSRSALHAGASSSLGHPGLSPDSLQWRRVRDQFRRAADPDQMFAERVEAIVAKRLRPQPTIDPGTG